MGDDRISWIRSPVNRDPRRLNLANRFSHDLAGELKRK